MQSGGLFDQLPVWVHTAFTLLPVKPGLQVMLIVSLYPYELFSGSTRNEIFFATGTQVTPTKFMKTVIECFFFSIFYVV